MENEIIETEVHEVEVLMSSTEAAELTDDIRSTSSALYVLLKRAHDEKAWAVLGYDSWGSYIENEFDFSRTRSYQLLNQARVIEEIEEASGVDLYITEREARSIKKVLPNITKKLEEVKSEVERDELSDEEARKKAQDIIASEGSHLDNEVDEVDTSAASVNDGPHDYDYDDVDVGAPGGMPERSIEDLTDEEKFFVENLNRTLSIFEAMPDPVLMGKSIKTAGTEKEVRKLADSAYSWITRLLDEIE